jgi:hypothetical protein
VFGVGYAIHMTFVENKMTSDSATSTYQYGAQDRYSVFETPPIATGEERRHLSG